MVIDSRTDEQRVVDAVVEAKIALDGPDADRWRNIVAEKKAQLDGFVSSSNKREQDLLHKQAMERDEFSRSELNEQVGLKSTHDAYTEKLARLSAAYAKAFDGLREYYANNQTLKMEFDGDQMPLKFERHEPGNEDVAGQIRRALSGQDDKGAKVETVVTEGGGLVTRIRRGLHSNPAVAVAEMLGVEPNPELVAYCDEVVGGPEKAQEGAPTVSGGLDAGNIGKALERSARAIGENVKVLGLDFSPDATEKG